MRIIYSKLACYKQSPPQIRGTSKGFLFVSCTCACCSTYGCRTANTLRYFMGYGIVQAIKIKSVIIMGNPVAHATHSTPWNTGFRFTEFF